GHVQIEGFGGVCEELVREGIGDLLDEQLGSHVGWPTHRGARDRFRGISEGQSQGLVPGVYSVDQLHLAGGVFCFTGRRRGWYKESAMALEQEQGTDDCAERASTVSPRCRFLFLRRDNDSRLELYRE